MVVRVRILLQMMLINFKQFFPIPFLPPTAFKIFNKTYFHYFPKKVLILSCPLAFIKPPPFDSLFTKLCLVSMM